MKYKLRYFDNWLSVFDGVVVGAISSLTSRGVLLVLMGGVLMGGVLMGGVFNRVVCFILWSINHSLLPVDFVS